MDEELEAATHALIRTRYLLFALAIFDLALGATATLFPETYLHLFHARFSELHPGGPTYWLTRTGMLWLFFAAVEGVAAVKPHARAPFVFLVGGLRLMDVPADFVYFLAADDLSLLGTIGLLFSPVFNLGAGLYLCLRSHRGLRAGLSSSRVARSADPT